MSRLWPELLRITLCPDQVVLERGRPIISFKGMEPRYFEPEVIPVEPCHEPTLWAAPVAALKIVLDGLPEQPHNARVILSNYFVGYPLIESFRATESRRNGFDNSIDGSLHSALTSLLSQHDCRLVSLEPRIVSLANGPIEELQGETGWLVVIEEGLASIGLVQNGKFIHLRNLYMWPASSVELLTLLDREAALIGFDRPPRNLVLWKRSEFDDVFLPNDSGWLITRLGGQAVTRSSHGESLYSFHPGGVPA